MAAPTDLLTLWYRALAADVGISIEVDPDERRVFTNQLYDVRKAANDPELQRLILCQPNRLNEIWICHKALEL